MEYASDALVTKPEFIGFLNPVALGQALTIQMPEGIVVLNVAYAIYDITGREVMQGTLDDTTALMHNLSSGTYVLKLGLGQNIHRKQLIVQ